MVLKNLPSGNSAFMKNRNNKMNLNTKLTKNFLNQLKNVPRNYTFLVLFLNTNIA